MPREDRLARLFQVYHLLSSSQHGLTINEVAEHCEVSRRTAYRDIAALQERGYPVMNAGGRLTIDRSYRLPPVDLTVDEAMALFIASRLAYRYADERSHALEDAFDKLAAVLPRAISTHVLNTVRTMKERPTNATFNRAMEILTRAWAESRTVRLWHRRLDEDEPRERHLDPYFIEPSGASRGTYVIGFDHASGEIRTFKVERIQAIELTDRPFTPPEDFAAETYLRGRWGIGFGEEVEVSLAFSPAAARRVRESLWHPSQAIEERPDGGLLLRLRVAGLVEIKPWVLSWGHEVEVLEPAELRQAIAEIAREQVARYGERRE